MAIRRLEELQCSDTVEVVIVWAWTTGVANPVDRDGWQLIGHDTLRFYQTLGVERLTALKRHISTSDIFVWFFSERHRTEYGVEIFVELPVMKLELDRLSRYYTCVRLSRACQVRRLYYLFGYDPTTWREAVGVEVDEKTDMSGSSAALTPFVDWTCDYP